MRAIAPGVFRFAQGHGNYAQTSGFNFLFMLLQLSQPFAAENSAKVPQEGEQNRAAAPHPA
jgi:hypothetical protein